MEYDFCLLCVVWYHPQRNAHLSSKAPDHSMMGIYNLHIYSSMVFGYRGIEDWGVVGGCWVFLSLVLVYLSIFILRIMMVMVMMVIEMRGTRKKERKNHQLAATRSKKRHQDLQLTICL